MQKTPEGCTIVLIGAQDLLSMHVQFQHHLRYAALFTTTLTCKACLDDALLSYWQAEHNLSSHTVMLDLKLFWNIETDGSYQVLLVVEPSVEKADETKQNQLNEISPSSSACAKQFVLECRRTTALLQKYLQSLPESHQYVVKMRVVENTEAITLIQQFSQYTHSFLTP